MLLKQISIIFGLFFVGANASAEWSYSGDGPAHWKDNFPFCGGKNQSPIDIQPSKATLKTEFSPVILTGYEDEPGAGSYQLVNNGHTVMLNVINANMVFTGLGILGDYILQQFHLHWGSTDCLGSEHTVNGLHYPAELHFVHKKSNYVNMSEALKYKDGVAVLGVMVDIGTKAKPAFDKITDQISAIKYEGSSSLVVPFKMIDLFPSNLKDFIRYNGSLTTPGCDESVIWTVFKEPISLSQTQVNALRSVSHGTKDDDHDEPIEDNFRPTLPLNSRTVYKTYSTASTPTQKTCSAPSALRPTLFYILAAIFFIKNLIF